MKTQLDFCYGVNAVADDIILKEGEPVQRFFPGTMSQGNIGSTMKPLTEVFLACTVMGRSKLFSI